MLPYSIAITNVMRVCVDMSSSTNSSEVSRLIIIIGQHTDEQRCALDNHDNRLRFKININK